MSIWLNYTNEEKLVLLQQTAEAKRIAAEQAIEKDWWVSVVLVALSKTSWADVLQFKGGTSLSKSWGLINRFSEDIDLAINRSFFHLPEETNQQRTKIRRKAFHYIDKKLLPELDGILSSEGITGYKIELITKNSSDMVTVVEVKYQSILPNRIDYLLPVIKIEFSAMSLDEPFVKQEITTLIHSHFPVIDSKLTCLFKSVLPERTFLEKIFLLHEEYQKENPRTDRMSRHLYDLEKMMDSSFAQSALENIDLYKAVVNHRQKFNNLKEIDYATHTPALIQISPPDHLIGSWRKDYENMKESFIYDENKKSFDTIIERMDELISRIRKIDL
ncbi:nucleotidyl transferase AbiEii/AbiGii toxin family protein [Massilibacteroides vaginae]|uniref:nucleotidyl transferase AbiEii/AbiGii toxin family protein n=1 Tax=Massilibacteroides vaginae TaxID=1673718 RepID=UPI000A1CEEFE|nr:nucleotidyl transferase AbiEii/AbiGii toxin family protein [Massilibacteroides vaginae]